MKKDNSENSSKPNSLLLDFFSKRIIERISSDHRKKVLKPFEFTRSEKKIIATRWRVDHLHAAISIEKTKPYRTFKEDFLIQCLQLRAEVESLDAKISDPLFDGKLRDRWVCLQIELKKQLKEIIDNSYSESKDDS